MGSSHPREAKQRPARLSPGSMIATRDSRNNSLPYISEAVAPDQRLQDAGIVGEGRTVIPPPPSRILLRVRKKGSWIPFSAVRE